VHSCSREDRNASRCISASRAAGQASKHPRAWPQAKAERRGKHLSVRVEWASSDPNMIATASLC
jgi:hypothetical protein